MEKQQKIEELAKEVFRKMLLDGRSRGLALATTKGVTTINVLRVNDVVDTLLMKWRGDVN